MQNCPGSFIESQAVTVKIPSSCRISDIARNPGQFQNESHEPAYFLKPNFSLFKLLIEILRIKQTLVGIINLQREKNTTV